MDNEHENYELHNYEVVKQESEVWHYGEKDAEWRDYVLLLCKGCGEMKKVWKEDIEPKEQEEE